ncbi:hypothetical protein Taro_046669 [Colocasia esculenta]|uniref:Uncharacterized protein n=1 Tax=Colocasia esculenta TaxID=4460 RepID=A0A843WQL9_COLES|nr:hypothetical protein [Colocasia esculenta]
MVMMSHTVRSRSRSGASGASVRQYLAGSSSHRRNEEEERRQAGETSAPSGRSAGEMLPPPERQEGSWESGLIDHPYLRFPRIEMCLGWSPCPNSPFLPLHFDRVKKRPTFAPPRMIFL